MIKDSAEDKQDAFSMTNYWEAHKRFAPEGATTKHFVLAAPSLA